MIFRFQPLIFRGAANFSLHSKEYYFGIGDKHCTWLTWLYWTWKWDVVWELENDGGHWERNRGAGLCFFKVNIPRTYLSSILGLQPSKRRPFPIKTRVMWAPDIYIYIYIYTCMHPPKQATKDEKKNNPDRWRPKPRLVVWWLCNFNLDLYTVSRLGANCVNRPWEKWGMNV